MARYQNVRGSGRENRKPRSKAQLIDMLATSHSIYFDSGGEDIDFGISAAKGAFRLAMQRAQAWSPGEMGAGPDPLKEANKALRELRMLEQLREKKMNQCRADIEETQEAEAAEKSEAADDPEPDEPAAESDEANEADEADETNEAQPVLRSIPEATPEVAHDQTGS